MLTKILASFCLIWLAVQGADNNELKVLNRTVHQAVGVASESVIGSQEFDTAVLKIFSALKSSDRIVTEVIDGSNAAEVAVEIFSYKSEFSFQWSQATPVDSQHEGFVYYASIKVQMDAIKRPLRVKSSIRKESFSPVPLVPSRYPTKGEIGHQ